jgi:hypothetical protein
MLKEMSDLLADDRRQVAEALNSSSGRVLALKSPAAHAGNVSSDVVRSRTA